VGARVVTTVVTTPLLLRVLFSFFVRMSGAGVSSSHVWVVKWFGFLVCVGMGRAWGYVGWDRMGKHVGISFCSLCRRLNFLHYIMRFGLAVFGCNLSVDGSQQRPLINDSLGSTPLQFYCNYAEKHCAEYY
jgi:hypothetical protein